MLLTLAWICIPAYATGNQNHECQGGHNCNEGGNGQAEATSEATATAESTATADATVYSEGGAGGAGGEGGAASATNEGNSIDIDASENNNIENNSSNIVLVPNNNTEKCLRVFGFAFGADGDSAAFGVPWRSKQCDYKGFASDADAQGNLELGWYWRCHMKTAYKTFKDKNESTETAIQQCHDRMIGAVGMVKTISTLTEQLAFSENERRIAREKHSESTERLTQACEESKDRILQACQK
jgi:hypothetical protein